VLLEAMAAGRPVVATRSGEIPWVLETAPGGTLVPEGDPSALARALHDLLGDPERRAALAAAGRAGVVTTFSPAASAAALADLVRAVAPVR
jgi:glycosyltransferase involved in cell wall biosynthesis